MFLTMNRPCCIKKTPYESVLPLSSSFPRSVLDVRAQCSVPLHNTQCIPAVEIFAFLDPEKNSVTEVLYS